MTEDQQDTVLAHHAETPIESTDEAAELTETERDALLPQHGRGDSDVAPSKSTSLLVLIGPALLAGCGSPILSLMCRWLM